MSPSPLRVGLMGCADIARRAMIPALANAGVGQLVAVASRDLDKARAFCARFGGEPLEGYAALLARDDIDTIYIPLPTALHDEWAPRVLQAGKHLLVEKSLASSLDAAHRILACARTHQRLVLENFMFPHHSQHAWVEARIAAGELGRLHLLRATFAFPPRPPGDIRYQRALGGGSLLDAGAYVLKAAQLFLGPMLTVDAARLDYDATHGVDLRGHAQLSNPGGQVAQISFGFDSYYQCHYELLGSHGKLTVERAYTPPPGFRPTVILEQQDLQQRFCLPADDHYVRLWQHFAREAGQPGHWEAHYAALLRQAELIEAIRAHSPWP